MATQLSFKDLNITFKKHPVTNDIVVSRDDSAIKQAIVNLLLTNKGERLMNPKYGSDIRSYLFEPLDYGTAARVRESIIYCVTNYEPRVSILEVKVYPDYDDNGFAVDMTYQVRGTDDPPVQVEFFLSRTR
jgi:hypothetical protein|tara:strand:+ start:196 stop:588 length:393 start_codon:yes stop_codon:yes gene_type:complete